MLFYLALAMPYLDGLQNFLEFINELCLYLTMLMLLSLEIFSAQVDGESLDSVGEGIILSICLVIFLNLIILIYSLYQPFKESLNDRDSTKLGRCLRYCCKISIPEKTKCFHDCCACGDEAKEVVSEFEKDTFLSIQPYSCIIAEIKQEAVDFDPANDSSIVTEDD